MDLATPLRVQEVSLPKECCCGRADCPFLAHSCSILEALERDVQTAARLGQQLLVRHESYMVDAEAERKRMSSTLEQLEEEKRELEARNAQTIEENRHLLNQLEGLNNSLVQSESTIESLTVTLHNTQQELHRLAVQASRAGDLEKQLTQLEKDQAVLHETYNNCVSEERTAIQRWRNAERTISDLHNQVERIEREAREDRARHVEVVGRMERTRAVEKELSTAAGRLKGAASAKAMGQDKAGSSVVSHFVRDILQDNANLQLGIVELREMLESSNEEVERLRGQLMFHQPVEDENDHFPRQSLQAELDMEAKESREVHVHHHYHASEQTTIKAKGPLQRRVKKKRHVITPSHFTPPAARRTSQIGSPQTPSSAATILSQTSVTIPQQDHSRHSHRWSQSSNQTGYSNASSQPESPYTNSHRTSSIFDRVFSDAGMESSRPTSPESNDPASPELPPLSRKQMADALNRSFSTPVTVRQKPVTRPPSTTSQDPVFESYKLQSERDSLDLSMSPNQTTIPEESESERAMSPSQPPSPSREYSSSVITLDEDIFSPSVLQSTHDHPLRRANSHDSLLSVSGMDIHTLRSRPSQMLLNSHGSSRVLGTSPSVSTSTVASKPILTVSTATAARPTQFLRPESKDILASMARRTSGDGKDLRMTKSRESLGQWVGGWVKGKWGSAPTSDSAEDVHGTAPHSRSSSHSSRHSSRPRSRHQSSAFSTSSIAEEPEEPVANIPTPTAKLKSKTPSASISAFKMRPPGINQSGPIFGMRPEPPTPFKVQVEQDRIDYEALRDGLGE
ncbi:hypothetical protein K402DRAFT_391661 [Aulographum hederae CBS 113979]|uniref:Uncharacterized protein n=1 Tax=Aulographum hederae CBS 113979 TaxID=1176131 RepID=A0A6G1H5Y5_9PEZI|nr:hypothetical protein K402DRAFT_391661 [Aulographum hederae CBS 113979]